MGRISQDCGPHTRALLEGGVISIEITMTTPNAIEAIRATAREFGRKALIGVGTVLDAAIANAAIEANATPLGIENQIARFFELRRVGGIKAMAFVFERGAKQIAD